MAPWHPRSLTDWTDLVGQVCPPVRREMLSFLDHEPEVTTLISDFEYLNLFQATVRMFGH
jgi:hypothetical protein